MTPQRTPRHGRVPVLMTVRELDLGGIERDVSKLARHLDRSRFEPHVASFRPLGARFEEIVAAGIPVLHLPVASIRSKSGLQGAVRLYRYIRENSIRIVHAFDAPTGIFAIPVARLARVPVTISSQLWVKDEFQGSARRLQRLAYRLSTAVYVNCQAVRQLLIEQSSVPPGRIFVCYNGVETDTFYPVAVESPRDPASPVVIGSVAVFRPEKDLPTLMEAFAGLHAKHPQTRLLLAGGGPVLPELESRRRAFGIEDCCRIVPPPASVADVLRSIDIFVSCSRYEAFSNAVLEAMACGCCPVGSRVGGTPELIADGRRGLLFEAGDVAGLAARLERLIVNPSERQQLARSAAAFAREELSIAAAASRLAGAYDSFLSRRSPLRLRNLLPPGGGLCAGI